MIRLVPSERFEHNIVFLSMLDDINDNFIINECDVTLKSGEKSKYYINFKESFAQNNPFFVKIFLPFIIQNVIDLDENNIPIIKDKIFLIGKGLSGSILVNSLATLKNRDHYDFKGGYFPIVIRNEVKSYGMVKKSIGIDKLKNELKTSNDIYVLIIDDILSTGGTIKEIIKSLEDDGIPKDIIDRIIVLVNRNPKIKEIDGIKVDYILEVKEI